MWRADNLTTFMCQLSWNLGASTSWNPQGLSRPVMGLLYHYHPEHFLLVIEQARGNEEWHWKPRRYFFPQAKCPSLWTNCNQTYTNCRACAMIYGCGSFRKIHRIEGEIQWRRYFVQVKCPLLLTDCNQTYTNCRACAVSDRCEVSERSLEVKARRSREGTLFFK